MGNVCGGQQDDVVDQDQPHRGPNIPNLGAVPWDKDFPPITMAQLQKRRDEFWDTRVEGRPEMWQAIRVSSEAEDVMTSKTILESAGLTALDIDKPDCCFCYDERGFRYEIPMYVLQLPRNLISADLQITDVQTKEQPSHSNVNNNGTNNANNGNNNSGNNDSNNSPSHPNPEQKSQQDDEEQVIRVKLRLSTGGDIEISTKVKETVLSIKKFLNENKKIPIEDQKVLYQGRLLSDHLTLFQSKVVTNTVLQIMVVSGQRSN